MADWVSGASLHILHLTDRTSEYRIEHSTSKSVLGNKRINDGLHEIKMAYEQNWHSFMLQGLN